MTVWNRRVGLRARSVWSTCVGGRARAVASALLAGFLLIVLCHAAAAQEEREERRTIFPYADFVLTGYGAASYVAAFDSDEFENNFTTQIVPIFLYQMGEAVLFEGELEFGFEEDAVETDVEYAQIDYLGWSHVALTGGKFLLPFGIFSQRFHPAWINKLPSFPLLYGESEAEDEVRPLLPVLSDIGTLVQVAAPMGERWYFDFAFYLTQGPRIVEEVEEVEEPDSVETIEELVPDVTIGTTFEDNNDNKLVGARAGFVYAPGFEAYLSAFYSRYDPGDALNLIGLNLAPEFRFDCVELLGEGILLWQQVFLEDGDQETVTFPGYYAQASVRLGRFEPVVRWSHLLEVELEDVTVRDDAEQLALGIDYWIYASVPVKLAYEVNFGFEDRLIVQWAFGF